jgi:hypothetical protein
MDIERGAYFSLRPSTNEGYSSGTNHVTTDADAQTTQHAQFISLIRPWFSETGRGHTFPSSHLTDFVGLRAAAY